MGFRRRRAFEPRLGARRAAAQRSFARPACPAKSTAAPRSPARRCTCRRCRKARPPTRTCRSASSDCRSATSQTSTSKAPRAATTMVTSPGTGRATEAASSRISRSSKASTCTCAPTCGCPAGVTRRIDYGFHIDSPYPTGHIPGFPNPPASPAAVQSFASAPELQPPAADGHAPGHGAVLGRRLDERRPRTRSGRRADLHPAGAARLVPARAQRREHPRPEPPEL